MDSGDMQELLRGYLGEFNWSSGVTKGQIMDRLAGRDEDLRTLVGEYLPDRSYDAAWDVMSFIPSQAWQSSQGDTWRGNAPDETAPEDTNFESSPVGQAEQEPYHKGGPLPRTPGFGDQSGQPAAAQTSNTGRNQSSGSGTPSANSSGQATSAAANAPQKGGMPGDGAGRTYDPGSQDSGVWPVSGSRRPANEDLPMQGMASFGQGAQGAAGYYDSGRSEAETIPVDDLDDTVISQQPVGTQHGKQHSSGKHQSSGKQQGKQSQRQFGATGSNAGEVDPAVSGSEEVTGEPPENTGGAGYGNAVGGGAPGDVADTGDNPRQTYSSPPEGKH